MSSKIFSHRNLFRKVVCHCQLATLPTHFYITFVSKLVGLNGKGEPGQSVRILWMSRKLKEKMRAAKFLGFTEQKSFPI
jgi:hypothetical protein